MQHVRNFKQRQKLKNEQAVIVKRIQGEKLEILGGEPEWKNEKSKLTF